MVRATKLGLLIGLRMGLRDIVLSYRRSTLGPLWNTATLGLQIVVIGFLFSRVFSRDLLEYVLHLSTGLVIWIYVSATLADCAQTMLASAPIIKNFPLPIPTHSLRVVVRHTIILLHNLSLVLLVYLFAGFSPSWNTLLLFPGLAIGAMNLFWLGLAAGVLSARFRDLPAIIVGITTVAFYVTPIIWSRDQITGSFGELLFWINPFLYVFDPIRLPLLGEAPSADRWIGAIVLLGVGALLTVFLEKKYFKRVVFWL